MSSPIACNLDAAAMPQRLADWKKVTDYVESRAAMDGGVRLSLCPEAPLGLIAELAAAEQSCCPFFVFALTIDARGAALEVRAPPEGLIMVEALFGSAP
jgi:hypothetical protein